MKTYDAKTHRNSKLSILIFVLLSAGILTAGWFYYVDYEHKYRTVVERQLSAIAELKVGELVQWRKERIADAELFYNNEVFSILVKRYFKNRNDRDARTRIVTWMGEAQEANRYDFAMLVDANLDARLVVPEGKEAAHMSLDEQISETLRSGKIVFQDFYRNDQDQRVYLNVLVPIRDIHAPKSLLGILALRIDPEEYLYPLIQQWPIPSRTSETLIVRKEGSDAVFLNELKFQTNTALNLRIPLTHTNTPAVEAVLGREGIIEGVDYRGMPVIAEVRSVPNSPWFLVARVDISEAFAPIQERMSMMIYLITALLVCSGLGAGLVWRREHARFYRQQYEGAQALIASESRYRRLFEAAKDGILILDAETGVVVDVNAFLIELLGYSLEQFIGKRIWELGFFKDTAASKLNLRELQEKKFIRYEDLPLEASDGRRIDVEFVSNVYLVDQTKVIQCNIRDVTDRRRAKGELIIANQELVIQNEEKEKRAAELVIASRELVFQDEEKEKRAAELVIANKELVFQDEEKEKRAAELVIANKELVFQNEEKEKRAAELIIANKELVFQNEEKERRAAELIIANKELVFQNEEKEKRAAELIIANKELVFQNEEKEKRAAELIIANKELVFQNEEKEKRAAELIIANKELVFQNKERKRAEESFARLAAIVESSDDAIIGKDLNGIITSWNAGAEKLFGYSALESVGRSINQIVPDDRLNEEEQVLAHIRRNEGVQHFETVRVAKEGRLIDVSVTSSPIKDTSGNLVGISKVARDITERKRAEEKLRETNDYLESLFNYANAPIIVWDTQFHITRFNNAFEMLTGRRASDVIGKSLGILFPPDRLESSMNLIRKTLKGERWNAVEIEILRVEGSIRTVLWNSATIFSPDGRTPIATIAQGHDITERKYAEEALKTSAELFRTASESLTDVVYDWDIKEKVDWYGDIDSITGYPPGGFPRTIGGWAATIHPEDKDRVLAALDCHLKNAEPYAVQYRVGRKDGEWRWWSARGTALRNNRGEPYKMIGSISDITERKRAEDTLRESEAKFRTLVENIPQKIFMKDRNYKWVSVNKNLARDFGLRPEEVVGKMDADLFAPELAAKYHADDVRIMETGKTEDLEEKYMAAGKETWINTIKTPVRGAKGEIEGVLGVFWDITGRKLAEKEVQEVNATLETRVAERTSQLEASNKELEAFSYSVSHDLRAPLRHVSGYVELLAKHFQSELSEKGLHYLDSIADSAHQMGKLIDDLLQFSRTGRAEMHMSQLDMNGIVLEAIESVRKDSPDRAIEWVAGKLPPVSGDEATLRLVWINLLSNAAKFTRTRAKAVIEIGAKTGTKEVIYFVKDNGVGFEMKYAQKLFGVFQRLHSTEEFEGTGVGLANVRRIVTRHGGRTWAEAELDTGATFYFSIPHN